MLRHTLIALALLAGASVSACAQNHGLIVDTHRARFTETAGQDAPRALAALSRDIERAPAELAGLLRLQRAMYHLQAGRLEEAANDLAAADPMMEVLDLDRDLKGQLAALTVSGTLAQYRPPPWEKLLINALGMAARLAAGDLSGAEVEARRFEAYAAHHTRGWTIAPETSREALRLGVWLQYLILSRSEGEAAHAPSLVRERAGMLELDLPMSPARDDRLIIVLEGLAGHRVPAGSSDRPYPGWRPGTLPTGESLRDAAGEALPPAVEFTIAADARSTFAKMAPALRAQAHARAGTRTAIDTGTRALIGGPPLGQLLGRKDAADLRCWSLAPGRVRVFTAPADAAVYVQGATWPAAVRPLKVVFLPFAQPDETASATP